MKRHPQTSFLRFITLLLILVAGTSESWASVTIVKDCDFENGETVFTADSRISLSNVIATNGDHMLQFTDAHNSANGYSFAHYDFSQDISSDVVEVKISFDFYIANQNASYYRFFTLGQSDQRIISDNSYNSSGAIFGFGLNRQSSTNYFSINGAQTATAASATNVLGAWAHVDITIDLSNKKVSYQIKSYDKSTLFYSADNIDFWDTNTTTCNQIDFFDKENYATSWLDNLVITKRINDGLYSYTVRSDAGKLIANGTCEPNATVTVPFPEFELRGYTLCQTANNGNNGYYRNNYTINNADQQEVIYYNQASYANVIYFNEAEKIAGATVYSSGNADIRCSDGQAAAVPSALIATGLHDGAYRIWGQVWGTLGTEFSFNADESKVWSLTTNGNLISTIGSPFQVTGTTNIRINAAGSSTRVIDCFYIQTILAYKESGSTIPVGTTNYRPDLVWSGAVPTFTSSNMAVATVTTDGITAHHNGTAVITAKQIIDGVEYYTTHTVTVTGETLATTTFSYDEINKIETYTITGDGALPEYDDGTTINIGYGSTDEIQVASGTLAHCIDAYGFWHAHLNSSGIPDMGTYYILRPKLGCHGKITINAYVGDDNGTRNAIRLVREDGTIQERITNIQSYTTDYSFNLELIDGQTYYLMAETGDMSGAMNGAYSNLQLHSIIFTQSSYVNTSEVIEIPDGGSYSIDISGTGMSSPTYSIVNTYGDLTGSVSINPTTGQLSGINAGGAIRVGLTKDGYTCYHLVTVAYPATEYPGHMWDFNIEGEPMTTAAVLRTVPVPPNTALGNSGDTWTSLYKVDTGGYTRAPEWRLNRAINGDNVLVVPETAGLLFNTGGHGFYMRNDDEMFRHVGIHDIGASFTIPYLKAGDIVELNWKHDAGNNGSTFSATHLKDLRNKTIPEDDTFLITESAERDKYNHVGRYSFIVSTDGDVTFTLKDAGYTDILSIRIYKGPYRSTMLNIDLRDRQDGDITPTELLLDNEVGGKGFTYNYCNQLYSTATGPAMYVLKGYRKQTDESQTLGVDYDHTGCVTGTDASRNFDDQGQALFILHTDEDAYPVSEAEKARLYELRKHLVGLEMYNKPWQSQNNSYNDGVIKARSGWGKVTIRMNNYTNDMKYVIGYTNDYTLTFGSAPHQKYPYTWDFTKISAGIATAQSDNAFNSIYKKDGVAADESDQYSTNWIKRAANGTYTLNTDNRGDDGSQYVPGAILVTTDHALSKYTVNNNETAVYANDELDGLGFNGQVTINPLPAINASARKTSRAMGANSLFSYRMDDENYAVNSALTAGSGTITFGADKREANSVAACGYGYKCDGDVGTTKYALLHLSRALVVGDVILIRAFATSTPNGSDYGLSLYESTSSATPWATMYLTGVKNHEETLCHVVTTGDALIGKQNIYVFRATGKSTYIAEIEVLDGSFRMNDGEPMHCDSEVTLTIPDLNDYVQDWIYISSSTQPSAVTNATLVTDAAGGGPDANQSPEVEDVNTHVYKYKVNGNNKVNSNITFAAGTNIYKIGVTHILKDIHSVGGTGWATEIRNQNIDHELTGYFTKNDVNAYTVTYDSYDMKTATVALTPINEDGYVPKKTGIVMKLDNVAGLSDANGGKNVPLFYPSYTRPATTTPVIFSTSNRMYNVDAGIDDDNRNYFETIDIGDVNYTKFVLTNVHWTYTLNNNTGNWSSSDEADAAGFYRLHIWDDDKDIMPAHNAFLLIPTENLPIALWNQSSNARRRNTIAIRTAWGEETTAIDDIELTPGMETDKENTAEDGEWYTLSGVRLPKRPIKPGLYICDGKKVVIKLKKH